MVQGHIGAIAQAGISFEPRVGGAPVIEGGGGGAFGVACAVDKVCAAVIGEGLQANQTQQALQLVNGVGLSAVVRCTYQG